MRYKVIYGADAQDYTINYAGSPAEAEAQFYRYNPEKRVQRVERYTGLRELAREEDEHEFLVNLIEAIEDEELETVLVDRLRSRGYGR